MAEIAAALAVSTLRRLVNIHLSAQTVKVNKRKARDLAARCGLFEGLLDKVKSKQLRLGEPDVALLRELGGCLEDADALLMTFTTRGDSLGRVGRWVSKRVHSEEDQLAFGEIGERLSSCTQLLQAHMQVDTQRFLTEWREEDAKARIEDDDTMRTLLEALAEKMDKNVTNVDQAMREALGDVVTRDDLQRILDGHLRAVELANSAAPPPPLSQLTVPAIAERNLVVNERLSAGSFGTVFRAKWNREEVAVKRLHAGHEAYGAMFKEARVHFRLRSSRVVLLLGIIDDPRSPALVLEFMAGGSLRDLLRQVTSGQSRIPLPWVLMQIYMDILVGLEYLHLEARVIHRDLKSANVLLDTSPEPRAKLTDFGLARTKSCSRSTVASSAGTSNWTAPEIFNQEGHSYATDVYAAGCVLFELVTGKEPWEGKSEGEIVGAVVQGFRPKLTAAMTLLPVAEEVEALFEGMLQHQPMHRTTLEHAARSVESFLEAAKCVKPPASAMMDHGSVSTPVPVSASNNLSTLLASLNLDAFESKLRDFGVETAADLAEVEDAELSEMGFKPLKLRQLRSAVLGVASSPTRMNAPVATLAVPAAVQHSRKVTDEETGVIDEAVRSLDTAEVNGDIGTIVNLMRAQAIVAAVQEKACRSLVSMTGGEATLKERMGFVDVVKFVAATGAIDAIVVGMRLHSSIALVQEWSCLALRNIVCHFDEPRVKARVAGAIEAVVAGMRAHRSLAVVQQWAVCALVNIIINDDNKVQATNAGVFEAVVAAMDAHIDVAELQDSACTVLRLLTTSGKHQDRAVAAGAIQTVLAAMSAHPDVVEVHSAACLALRNIMTVGDSENADDIRITAAAAGVIEAVVRSMRSHPNDTAVQEWASRILLISTGDTNQTVHYIDNQARAGAAGAIETMVAVLIAHPDVVTLQHWACRALHSIITGNADNQAKAETSGAMEAVLTAMSTHLKNAETQEYACATLSSLSVANVRDGAVVGMSNAVVAVMRALSEHHTNKSEGVHKQARAALISMSGIGQGDDRTSMTGMEGLFVAVAAVMGACLDDAEVQKHACTALTFLCVSDQYMREVGASGAIEAVVRAMGAHLTMADVQEQACRALINISRADTNRRKAGAAGAIEAVVAAAGAHQSVSNVQINACWSLVNLILDSSDNKTKAIASGAAQAAVAAMNSHPDVSDVQRHACQVLMLLTAGGVANGDSDDESKPWKAGVVEAVLRALALHKGVDEVQTRVRKTLLNIIGNAKSGEDGLFYVVVAAMGAYPSVAAVQEWGCLSLHNLIGCESWAQTKQYTQSLHDTFHNQFRSLKYAFVAAALGVSKPGDTVVADDRAKAEAVGAIGAVLAAMSTHRGVAAVQEAGCRALLRITSHPSVDASLHVKIGQSGAIEAVLLAMKSHLGVATVQAWACAALLMMTADNIDENAIKATKAGGIEAVLAAMGAHPDVVDVQRWSCGALDAMIVETGSKDADDAIVIKAGEAAAAELAVITAMGAHQDIGSLQEFACGALDNLTSVRDADAKSFIAEEHAAVVVSILRALKSHGAKKSSNNALQISSRNVLHKICVGGACSFDDESDTEGLFEGLVAAMRTYPDSAAMQELACSAQKALNVSEAANRLRASKAGASNAIVAAMGTHLSVADVQSAACSALINMCVQDDNKRRASDAGAIEAVVTAMLTHPNMANVQEKACWALLNMSESHDDIKSKAGSAGAIEAAVAAMVALPGEASVQGKACAVLATLTDGVPDNKTKAGAAGVMDVVLVARKKHPDNADVQKHGKALVERLW
jgi:serine/threonine protein kinase